MTLTNKYSGFLSKAAIMACLAIVLLSSCVPMRKIRYLQADDKDQPVQAIYNQNDTAHYKVQPGDDLFIKIASLDEKYNSFETSNTYNNYYTEAAIYLNSYSVSDSGFVQLPLIGKIKVENLMISQIRDTLQILVNEYVKSSVVIVKLANFKVSMLGEFNAPGKYLVYQDKISIFEAIAMAGDMTTFAKKDEVMLVRQEEKGTKTYFVNVNDRSILSSDFFYLKPNDIVYVQPLKGKQFAFSEFPYVLILTTVTTTILLLDYFSNH
jgi:polysaccharide biosynthesis/export protein